MTPSSPAWQFTPRSEEHTSELQSLRHLVCRLLLEKKKGYIIHSQGGVAGSGRWRFHSGAAARPYTAVFSTRPRMGSGHSKLEISFWFFFFLMIRLPPSFPLFPYTTLSG